MPRKPRNNEDLLQDLPPIDGASEDDNEETEVETDLDLEAAELDRDLDDSVASELLVGQLVDEIADNHDPETDETSEVDIGAPTFDVREERTRADDDAPGLLGEDPSVGIDPVADTESLGSDSDDHPGASGDDIDESCLPELDSDDEADLPGGLGLDESLDLADEVPLPAWAPVRWERAATPLVALPMNAITIAEERVGVAGQGAAVIEPDEAGTLITKWLELAGIGDEELIGVVLGPGQRLLALTHSGTYGSMDGGATLHRVGTPQGDASSNQVAIRAADSDPSSLFAVTSSGVLLGSANEGAEWQLICTPGRVLSMTTIRQAGLATAIDADGAALLMRGTLAGGWEVQPLDAASAPTWWARTSIIALCAEVIAVGTARGEVAVSFDRGLTWTPAAVPAPLIAMAIVRGTGGALVVGTFYVESQDKSYLFAIEQGAGPLLVADLSPDVAAGPSDEVDESEGLGNSTAITWDEARGWLWVAGRFGVQAWKPRSPA